jgi:hypothetical protein
MASHSAMSKSRAILICVIVVGSLVELSAYYYVQNFTSNSSSPPLASFQIANLTINPYEARVDQPVVISVSIVNLEDIQGSYSLSLKINDSVAETKELALSANESQLVTFSVTETSEGSYNATVGDLVGIFSVTSKPTPMPATLKIANLFISPIEAWLGQLVNVSVDVTNKGNENISYLLPFLVNGGVEQSAQVELAPGASSTVTVSLNESRIGTYPITCGGQTNTLNIVPTGKHTLHYIASRGGLPFTLDGVSEVSPFAGLVDVGIHSVVVSANAQIQTAGWGSTTFVFSSWNDGSTSLTKTVDVEAVTYVISNYVRQGSCPSLYVWNGTSYDYSAEVSDGAGWLGYLGHFQTDGSMVFSYNYPWDYIKLDSTQLQPLNGYYNMKIAEMSDEIFYLDQAKMVAIDHPAGTDVFSTTSTFIYNLSDQGTMYTVNTKPAAPVSAVDGQGQSILPLISKLDQNFTAGTRWTWNNITLNLGDLTGAKEIKLVIAATINWPTTQAGGNNFLRYASQPGVAPSPPPYMEVKAQNGSWIRVPDDREFPVPDVTDNVFVVNLTGLFPTNNYELRINTYQDIRFDYIGVDTTSQQNITVHTVEPSSAVFEQAFSSDSNSSGAFTRYGDVKTLLQSADDKFVIGREGDAVSLQFPADLSPVPKGMVRDYFVVASCWFKGKGLSYVPFTVDPLPFQAMTSFPYPPTESYPYDNVHQTYLQFYNTRIINSR